MLGPYPALAFRRTVISMQAYDAFVIHQIKSDCRSWFFSRQHAGCIIFLFMSQMSVGGGETCDNDARPEMAWMLVTGGLVLSFGLAKKSSW